ncbi:MAG TPA: S1-like domain-containing RNA-binding protein [Haploplasma sp.]|nr:S1-like domain-containing RNA-binding protein [Haploplasma sp.]
MPKIGEMNELKVLRKTDIGFMLETNGEEIFLHNNESNYLDLQPNELVTAFLYFDQKGRLAATLKESLITVSKPAVLEVVDTLNSLGVFLNMGINKDLLLSKDDLPISRFEWPQVGDKILVRLQVKGKLVAKIVAPSELEEKNALNVGDQKDFYVQVIGAQGLNLISEDFDKIFVHNSMLRGAYRLGEKVSVTVTNHNDRGYTGSMIKQKEELRFDDAEIIMEYLRYNKTLNLTAKSSARDIEMFFDMSRKAFKRALGLLYRDKKVIFTETQTILVEGELNE